MFGGRKKEDKRSKPGRSQGQTRTRGGLSQFGLLDIPGMDGFDLDNTGGDDDDDDDLEAELLALTAGKSPLPRREKKKVVPEADLDSMVSACMKDIPSDEEVSGDDDDPDLEAELKALAEPELEAPRPSPVPPHRATGPQSSESLTSVLEERIRMYQLAEKNAKEAGESSRARRFNRGLKTLNDLMKQAKSGRPVSEEDIPPPVATAAQDKPASQAAAPMPPPGSENEEEVKSPVAEPSSGTRTPSPRKASSPPEEESPTKKPLVPPRIGVPLPGLVNIPQQEPQPTIKPAPPVPSVSDPTLKVLMARRDQYKAAALRAKKAGDNESAIKFIRIAKQFEPVIAAAESGNPVDLAQMPPPPPSVANTLPGPSGGAPLPKRPTITERGQGSSPPEEVEAATDGSEDLTPPDRSVYGAPPPPETVMEALEQRLNKYRECEKQAKEEENSSKARRMGRIAKQYEDAIKLHRAGKPFAADELPTPPGFGPIPTASGPATSTASSGQQDKVKSSSEAPAPRPVPSRTAPAAPPVGPKAQTQAGPQVQPEGAQPEAKVNVRYTPQARQEKQLIFLTERQKEFRLAAIEAKKRGDIGAAKELLKQSKGFDALIEASKCGLPVDMNTLPVAPGKKEALEADFEMVTADDCAPEGDSDGDIFQRIEDDLKKQIMMCMRTRDHFKVVGDVASANRLEQLAVHSKKDLDAVKAARKRRDRLPKFHYESKTFSVVQCCTELTDNDLELQIIQGINYNVPNPKEVDTYVRFEFPFPAEAPYKDKTNLIRDTNSPQYNQTFIIPIQRNSRACQRVFKRQALKIEVWSKGGFLRSDILLGSLSVKLQPLETKCVLHESFDLMDGRKALGGKLELKMSVRNPIVTKQVEQIKEKWLVIDQM